MKILLTLYLSIAVIGCDPSTLEKTVGDFLGDGELTQSEIAQGLKEALEIGISNGSDRLSAVDGYFKSPYKIFLPDDLEPVINKLQLVPGFQNFEQDLIEKVNRSAEDAAKKAKPIFVSAIRSMTINDALDILMGQDDAATRYLERQTSQQLYDAFNPVIVESLNKFGVLDYYENAISTYNKIPFVKKMNPRLDDHVTVKALDGLFSTIENEEKAIRENPAKRVTDLLKRVFAKQD